MFYLVLTNVQSQAIFLSLTLNILMYKMLKNSRVYKASHNPETKTYKMMKLLKNTSDFSTTVLKRYQ